MSMVKMCTCISAYHYLPHWKCVLRCCYKFHSMVISSQEENKDPTKMCPKIPFHVYRNTSHCKLYGICPYKELTTRSTCYTMLGAASTAKVYKHKDIVLLDTPIK